MIQFFIFCYLTLGVILTLSALMLVISIIYEKFNEPIQMDQFKANSIFVLILIVSAFIASIILYCCTDLSTLT